MFASTWIKRKALWFFFALGCDFCLKVDITTNWSGGLEFVRTNIYECLWYISETNASLNCTGRIWRINSASKTGSDLVSYTNTHKAHLENNKYLQFQQLLSFPEAPPRNCVPRQRSHQAPLWLCVVTASCVHSVLPCSLSCRCCTINPNQM